MGRFDGIWVHNKDCWTSIPSDAKTSRVGNKTVYTFENRGRSEGGKFVSDPDHTNAGSKKYDWINEERHPDTNVASGFETARPTPSSNQYFQTEAEWQAPECGTGLNYKVYHQDIDSDAKPFEADGDLRTNTQ